MANDNGEGSSRAQETHVQDDSITSAAPAVNQPAPAAPASPRGPAPVQTSSFYEPRGQQPLSPQQPNYATDPNAYGQPFQPYQPYQQQYQPQMQVMPTQPMPVQQPGPERRSETKGWRLYYLIFHGLLILIGVIDLAMSLSLLKYSFYNDPTTIAISTIGVPVLIILWSGAELITRALRTDHIGIHPGAHVGVFLILWLAAAIVGGISATFAAYAIQDNEDSDSGRTCWDYPTQSYTEEACGRSSSRWTQKGTGVFTGVVVMKCFEWLLTFVLFIQACVDTRKRNVSKRPVVFVQAPYWPGPMGQGFMPMQQQGPMPGHAEKGQSIPMQERAPVHRPTDYAPVPQQPQEVHQGQRQPQVQEYYSPGQAV